MSIILIIQMAMSMIGVEPETLFSQEIEKGWYGSPIVKVGQIGNHSALFTGAQGGWILNHKLVLGGKGYVLTNPFEMQGLQDVNIGFGCCGFYTEYTVSSNNFYHISIENLIGLGGIYNSFDGERSDINSKSDACFVLEPGVKMNLNVARNFQLSAGVNYRFVGGIDYDGGVKEPELLASNFRNIDSADIEGLSFQLELKMGRF